MEEDIRDILPEGDPPPDIQQQLEEEQEPVPRERGGEILEELENPMDRVYEEDALTNADFDQDVIDASTLEGLDKAKALLEAGRKKNLNQEEEKSLVQDISENLTDMKLDMSGQDIQTALLTLKGIRDKILVGAKIGTLVGATGLNIDGPLPLSEVTGGGIGAILGGLGAGKQAWDSGALQQLIDTVSNLFPRIHQGGLSMELADGTKINNLNDYYQMKSTSSTGGGSLSRGGSKLFKGDSVKANNFVSRGNLYAQGSLNKGRKNNLLKGWNNKITDDNGVDFMLVRGRNNKFNLRPVHDVELDLLKKSGYTGTAKEMNKIRSEINRALGNRPGTRYWDILSEGDKDTYIEHLVAKGQHWFWKLPHSQRSWSPPSRNTAFNLRIVNNQRYKKLKDRIETIVYPQNYVNPEKALSYTKEGIPVYKGKLKPNLGSRLIIHVEDPLTTTTNLAAKDKKLLGNLTIRRANDGKVIGKFGDYLDAIYSPTFEAGLREAGLLKTGENITDWRTNFLTEKFNFIQSEAPLLNERAKKIVHRYVDHKDPMEAARSAVIDEALVDDLTAFKANFPWADIPPGLLDHYRRNLGL